MLSLTIASRFIARLLLWRINKFCYRKDFKQSHIKSEPQELNGNMSSLQKILVASLWNGGRARLIVLIIKENHLKAGSVQRKPIKHSG